MNRYALPAQQILVERLLSWSRVKDRLSKFAAIERAFPYRMLLARRSTPPYFCHYMAWRLGTFEDEHLILRVNELLEHAEGLPNWEHERALLEGGDFADFWSLVWQLQVGEYLSSQGTNVSWHAAGPDLSIDVNGQRLFVECYVYRKSFGVELFVEELLLRLGGDLRVSHDPYLPFSMPKDALLCDKLSSLLSPLIDDKSLAAGRGLAQAGYPVVLSRSSQSTLAISLEGSLVAAYDPSALRQNAGDPTKYLEVALCEAANAKAKSNKLHCHQPNLLVVSFALSAEAQEALARRHGLSHSLPKVGVSENVEAFAFAAIGIDSALSKHDLKLVMARFDNHPAHAITVPAT